MNALRFRSTASQIDQLRQQIIEVLDEDHPQSVRHVFYRLTDPRLPFSVPKTENGYRKVGRELVKMRQSGVIPFDWISDSTRMGYHVNSFESAAEFISTMAGQYRAQTWNALPAFPEVWCESRSLAGVLRPLCREYGVSLYPAGGFSSITFIWEAAQELNRIARGRTVHVLYAGDYDPAGVLIDVDIQRKLRQHLSPDIDLRFERIGITAQQVEEYDLPAKPRKDGERRASHITATVEAEAMPAEIMRTLFRDRINSLLPPGHLDVIREAERSEREFLFRVGAMIDNEEDRPVINSLAAQYSFTDHAP